MASFIRMYLEQLSEYGYLMAPMEVDARNAALVGGGEDKEPHLVL